jgi:hypothetical protein
LKRQKVKGAINYMKRKLIKGLFYPSLKRKMDKVKSVVMCLIIVASTIIVSCLMPSGGLDADDNEVLTGGTVVSDDLTKLGTIRVINYTTTVVDSVVFTPTNKTLENIGSNGQPAVLLSTHDTNNSPIVYSFVVTQGGSTSNMTNILLQPQTEVKYYIYRNTNGDLTINIGPNPPTDLGPGSPPGITPDPDDEEGNDGPIIEPLLRDYLGTLAVKNLTAGTTAKNIGRVTFTQGTKVFTWTPGPNAGNEKSIILRPGDWHVRIEAPGVDIARVKTIYVDSSPNSTKNTVYFFRNSSGQYDMDTSGGNPPYNNDDSGGNGDEGEGGDPDSNPGYNPNSLGVVIVRNLTNTPNDRGIESVTFVRAGKGPFTMVPGPDAGSEKSILLTPGNWTVEVNFVEEAGDNPADGVLSRTKVVMASAGHSNYVYFYKRLSGPFELETGNSIPTVDFDPSNTTTTIADGSGVFHITNGSVAGSIIADVKWGDAIYSNMTIAQGNSRDVQVEAGTKNLSFRISTKSSYGIELAYTLHNRETIDITYMDSFEDTAALPPPGKSSIKVDNKSSYTVNRIVIFKADLSEVVIENTAFEPPGPIGPNALASKIVDNAGDVVIQLYMSSGADNIVLSRAHRLYNSIVLISIGPNDTDDGTGKGTEDEDSTESNVGGLRVFNNYYAGVTNAPDMKIFKFKLYKKDSGGNYPTYPTSPNYTWNGADTTAGWIGSAVAGSYNPIFRGRNENIYNLAEGYYKLVIVASVYPWSTVAAANYTIPGTSTTITETTVSYDCGDVLITDNIERQYYFNVAAGKEKDAPRGFVEIMISYTGIAGDYDTITYHPASFVEIVTPGTNVTTTGDGSGIYSRLFSYWPGSWVGLQEGPYVGPNHLVLKHQGIIGYAQTAGPYYIPPGFYYGRYGDSYSSGRIFGNAATYWRVMDLKSYGGHRVYVQLDPTVGLAWN